MTYHELKWYPRHLNGEKNIAMFSQSKSPTAISLKSAPHCFFFNLDVLLDSEAQLIIPVAILKSDYCLSYPECSIIPVWRLMLVPHCDIELEAMVLIELHEMID